MKTDDRLTRDQVQSLDLEIQELRRSFTAADLMAVEQLNAAKDKIRSLHNTVQKISQDRAEVKTTCSSKTTERTLSSN